MKARRAAAALALALLAAPGAPAAPAALRGQATQPRLADKIAAIVGDRIILLTEIDEEINQQRAQGQLNADSTDPAALRRRVLDQLVDEEVLYQHARRDTTIQVSDQEVQNAVEEQVRRVRGQFSSDAEFRTQLQAAGLGTPEEYRRFLADQQRRDEYVRRYLEKQRQEGKLRGGSVTEQEIRQAFEQLQRRPGGLRNRPPKVTFRQIVVAPKPSPAAQAAARTRAESALAELRRGGDFATLARRYSDDPGTKDQGGDLNWVRRGLMVREFEDALFRLRPGQISDIVHTPFGYHIIMVERVQPAEVKARHILCAPAVTQVELDAAQRLADSVATLLRGGAGLDSLAALYADTSEPREIGPVERSQLTPPYQHAFENAAAGAVLGPFAVSPETPNRTKYVVAAVTDVQPERPYTFDDEEVRDRLRENLRQEHAIRALLASLRRETYVDIRL